VLNIYTQEAPHDDVIIVANSAGIALLRRLLDDVMKGRRTLAVSNEAYVSDGEGFLLQVHKTKAPWNYPVPYRSPVYRSRDKEANSLLVEKMTEGMDLSLEQRGKKRRRKTGG